MSRSRDFLLPKNVESQLGQNLLALHELLFLAVRVILAVLSQLSSLLAADVFGLLFVVNVLQNKLFLHLVFRSSLISSIFWWFLRSIHLVLDFEVKALAILLVLLGNVSDVYLLVILWVLWFCCRSFGTMSILLLELTEIDVVMSILVLILLLIHVVLVILWLVFLSRLIVVIILFVIKFLSVLHLQVLVIFRIKHLILVVLLLRLFFHS